jgi:predicted amidohydrolase
VARDLPLRVALGELDTGWHDPATALARAERVVTQSAAQGAQLVVLPEMCTTGFTMRAEDWAEPLDGPSAHRLAAMAAVDRVWVLGGLAVRAKARGAERPVMHNAAVLFDPAGRLHATYVKQRVFSFAGEHESYMPGDAPLVVDIHGVRISPFICFDLRFPELFREVATQVDAIVVIANWPAERRAHWDVLVRARAIENQCFMIAVNRTGDGGGVRYDGGSAAYGPWGETLPNLSRPQDGPAIVSVDVQRVREIRARYPFLNEAHRGASGDVAIGGLAQLYAR